MLVNTSEKIIQNSFTSKTNNFRFYFVTTVFFFFMKYINPFIVFSNLQRMLIKASYQTICIFGYMEKNKVWPKKYSPL